MIGPDESDPRASFLSWDNLATQDIYAANASLPFDITKWWNAFFNISGSFISNKAAYENGAVIDLQAWTYGVFSQNSFKLPMDITGELSGRFSGPGIWGGVFKYEASWGLNAGLQKKFLNNNMNVKLSVNDLFNQGGWKGVSYFNGLENRSIGKWDSRRISLSISYKFGNNKIKTRDRKTGIDEESKRVGESE